MFLIFFLILLKVILKTYFHFPNDTKVFNDVAKRMISELTKKRGHSTEFVLPLVDSRYYLES